MSSKRNTQATRAAKRHAARELQTDTYRNGRSIRSGHPTNGRPVKPTTSPWRRRSSLLRGGLIAGALVTAAAFYVTRSGASPPVTTKVSSSRPYVGGDLHSLVVDPADPNRVMVGGHDGAALSNDGGKTWVQITSLQGTDAMSWVIDPRHPASMYVGGHSGFYVSSDGGKTWAQYNARLPSSDVHGLGIDPHHPNVLYAYLANQGIYKSTDRGRHWSSLNGQVGTMGPILVAPRSSNTLYLASVTGMQSTFSRSTDGGKTWKQVGPIPGGMTMWIAQDERAPKTVYAANQGVWKSTNGGKTWRAIGSDQVGGASTVAVSPTNSQIIYAGALDGTTASVFRSNDGGAHWIQQN